jgi:1-acyl-sn-glycerol-3-phosphate acyltransferase
MRQSLYLAWVYTMVGVWTLSLLPSSLLITVLTGSHRVAHRVHSRFWGRMILWSCGIRLQVHHLERLRRDGSYVLMINSTSRFAAYVVAAGMPLQWRAMLGIQVRRIPVFAWLALLAGHIFIDTRRSRQAMATFNAAADKLHGGLSILVFPEAKHHEGTRLLPFRAGGFHLAVHAGIPVVPLTVVEQRRSGTTCSVAALDLYVDFPLATMDRTAEDIPILLERTRAAMQGHLAGQEGGPGT